MKFDEEPKVRSIKKIVYFCGICNKIISDNWFCKPCNYQFTNEEFDFGN